MSYITKALFQQYSSNHNSGLGELYFEYLILLFCGSIPESSIQISKYRQSWLQTCLYPLVWNVSVQCLNNLIPKQGQRRSWNRETSGPKPIIPSFLPLWRLRLAILSWQNLEANVYIINEAYVRAEMFHRVIRYTVWRTRSWTDMTQVFTRRKPAIKTRVKPASSSLG